MQEMCFSPEISIVFAIFGVCMVMRLFSRGAKTIACCIFYFCLMELLQAVQYSFIAPTLVSPECAGFVNKLLTTIGFVHICYQPYIVMVYYEYKDQDAAAIRRNRPFFVIFKRLCIIGGSMLLARHVCALMIPSSDTLVGDSPEWLRGPTLCTHRGTYHLAWSVPMSDVTYYTPGLALHSFLMFVLPLSLCELRYVWSSMQLFVTGPVVASLITDNLMEQPSIWCFFSMFQCASVFWSIKSTYSEQLIRQ